MKNIALYPNKQKRRLRWVLLLFFITLSLPIYYLLQTVYSQLENEAYFNARQQAEALVTQIDLKLKQLLDSEQKRPIAEYQFFNVMENPLLSESSGVKFSPLSEVPPKTAIKGLIGYFQINTDGSFHLPALPEIGQDNISGLSLAELESRLKIKHQLRNLLSIKPTINPVTKADSINESLLAKKVEKAATNQPYIEEFKQQSLSKDNALDDAMESRALSVEKNKAASKMVKRPKAFASAKKYKTRKEIVQLPDQIVASSYFNRSGSFQAPIDSNAEQEITAVEQDKPSSAINIFSFETEVTPIQMLLLGKEYFCFYRYVWHDNNRYTQGFVVNNKPFITALSQNLSTSSNLSSLLFSSNTDVLQQIDIALSPAQYRVYDRQLSSPFEKLHLTVNTMPIDYFPGSRLIDFLAFSIYTIFLLGFIAFHRLGSKQIDLANQQQNFISAVSHELKTPLTSIRMYAEMLRSNWVSDESKKQTYYDFIFFESERLSRLIANILQLAKMNHNQRNTDTTSISALSLLQRVSAKVELQIAASTFTLNVSNANEKMPPINVLVNEDAFLQIIINLIDNAVKFANKSDNKQIDIGYRVDNDFKIVQFFIRDYGPGIEKKQLKKIFQLFYRSEDELTRTTPGTGIGLALVAQLVESMQAKINVVNKHPGVEFQIVCKTDPS